MDPTPKPADYAYSGVYNTVTFSKSYTAEFKSVPKYNLASMSDLLFVVGKIGSDPRIVDIRWAAYMLATTFIESSHTVRVKRQTVDKQGHVKAHTTKVWRNFRPIEEAGHGKGRDYYLPVKIRALPSGDVRVTEYDGEQWTVSLATAKERAMLAGQARGVPAAAAASAVYTADDGDEHSYFGRGYVQLTWWNNYAGAGVTLGRGLAFLLDPDLVDDPDVAYSIMSTGMITGGIFANGRKLSQYFSGAHTDYVNARNMVNGGAPHANKVEVANIAQMFEKVLFASKAGPAVANQ